MEKLLSDSRHFFYLVLSTEGDILESNKLFEEELLEKKDEQNLFFLVKPIDHKELKNVLNDCLHSPGKNFLLELIIQTPAGKKFMVVWELCGEQVNNNFTIIAIGQKREYENEIWDFIENHKLTQQHFQSLFDQNEDAVCSFDPTGTFLTGNKAIETISGYSIPELKGTNIHLLFHPKDHFVTIDGFQNAVSGQIQHFEVRVVTKYRKIRYCNVTILPIVLNNLIFGVYVIAKDVTDKVLAERKIARDRDLMQQVQNKLHLLVEELTQTNNDLRQFTYITSHNLRSPLANLLGIIDLFDRNELSDYNLQFLDLFKDATNQLADTVNDLMEILVVKNKVNIEKEPIELESLLADVVKSISKTVQEAGAEMIASLPVNIVSFNKTYLESILLNLLTNSIKYRSPDRPLVINVSTSEAPDYIMLAFKDNGIGMNVDRVRDKIFGLYQRFHNNADSKGLGLFIVKSQVTALGGRIEVDSKVNEGTTFTIYFKK